MSRVRGAADGVGQLCPGKVVGALGEFFAAQNRVETLNRADGDAADVIDVRRGEVLDVVELGELPVRVGRDKLVELVASLLAEIGAIDEEEDATRASIFDEPIRKGAGGVGLARASGHVNEGSGSVLGM